MRGTYAYSAESSYVRAKGTDITNRIMWFGPADEGDLTYEALCAEGDNQILASLYPASVQCLGCGN